MSKLTKRDGLLSVCIILLGVSLIACFASGRHYPTFETETDYLGGFIVEAKRVLLGEPLQLDFHPPFYPIMLAIAQIFVEDWFRTGLLVSFFSSVVVLGTTFFLFYRLLGKSAAWGCLLGLLSSRIFVSFSAFATSDLFYLAVYSSCCLSFFLAFERESNRMWAVSGALLGISLLTRSNSLTLMVLLALPWLQKCSMQFRIKRFLWVVASMTFVLGLWFVFAKHTGSQLAPRGNHVNLALTYFSETDDRLSGDALSLVEDKFENLVDVITYDPVKILVTYSEDLLKMIKKNFMLIAIPLNLFVLPGLVIMVFRRRQSAEFLYLYLFVNLLQIALVNLKYYEMRYYLFLVPVFGAGVGLCLDMLFKWIPGKWARWLVVTLLFFGTLIGIKDTYEKVYSKLHLNDEELEEAVPAIRNILGDIGDRRVVARKPHISFYTNSKREGFPSLNTIEELGYGLQSLCNGEPVYLYYGGAEKYYRPQFASLKFPERTPGWLKSLVQSEKEGGWVFYQIDCDGMPLKPRNMTGE